MNPSAQPSREKYNSISRRICSFLGWALLSIVISLVLLEVVGRIGLILWPHLHKPTVTDIVPQNPAYAQFPWAADCMKEQRDRERDTYFPFRLWGVAESHGSCINNDVTDIGVIRRTVNPDNPACRDHPALKIWLLGGSAVYGTLVPDWATLPSALSRLLNDASHCVKVSNLGVEGYVTNQELLLLMEQLKAGHVPDVVIFYDGFNDADEGTSLPGPAAHLRYNTMKRRLEGGVSSKFDILPHFAIWRFAQTLSGPRGRKGLPRVPDGQLLDRARQTLSNYLENLRIARLLGDAYGFKVCAYWQPSLIYGRKPRVVYEQQIMDLSATEAFPFVALAPVYREAAERAGQGGQFVFLGGIFDDDPHPRYLDSVHLNPEGNALAAQALTRSLADCLK